jgi:hypothetical protein
MKQAVLVLIFLAGLVTISSAQTAEKSSWDAYEPRTLQSIIDAHKDSVADLDNSSPGPNKMLLSGDSFPSKVCLVYLGKSRSIAGKRKELLESWKKMLKEQVPENLVEMFSTEMLFREGDREFWIAVQKPLLEPLSKEVKVGGPMNGYVIWMGAIRANDHWEWLFAMNEFDTPKSARATLRMYNSR